MESTLAFLSDLASHIPCRRLVFAKRPDIVDYVQNQLEGIALVAP
jgi:hypothetical protein